MSWRIMIVPFNKLFRVIAGEGLLTFAGRFPRRLLRAMLRPVLPPLEPIRIGEVVTAYDRKWLDAFLRPDLHRLYTEGRYEETLVDCIHDYVRAGDRIVVVGGGIGVTAAVAAQRAQGGAVYCFEASASQMRLIQRTLKRSAIANRVVLRHAAVGPLIAPQGSPKGAARIEAEALPACDILELDCEGSEMDILSRLAIRPRVILVETHGCYGAATTLVRGKLEKLGYRVTDRGPAEPSIAGVCSELDIMVLAGERLESCTAA